MEKFYCTNCMLLNEEKSACLLCGNLDLKRITISVQSQKSKCIVEE